MHPVSARQNATDHRQLTDAISHGTVRSAPGWHLSGEVARLAVCACRSSGPQIILPW
jgi:hypothetical protein